MVQKKISNGYAYIAIGVKMSKFLLVTMTLCVIANQTAIASDDEIFGTYKLVSSTRKILDTGEVVNSYGEHPKGFITYGRDGRMLVLITGDTRPKANSLGKLSDVDKASLFQTMLAYGGTFKYSGNTIEHHIDLSWNEIWNDTTVVRDVIREGDRLIFTTKPAPAASDGKLSISTIIWEKVKQTN
jgi:hypothetical protein